MRLKVYQAPNIGAAMAMVRDELGPDALILANRTVDGGVELTAAQEDAPVSSAIPLPDEAPRSASPRIVPLPTSELARTGSLKWHGVPVAIAGRLARGDLGAAVGAEFTFGELPCSPGSVPLLLVGPPGAGKTLTTARLATRLKLSGQSAMVITADGHRAGAAEQLAAFTRLLGLTLIVADTPKQLVRAIAQRPADAPVLIDMPGLCPSDPQDQKQLRECQAATNGTIALVLPAGLDPAEAEEMALDFKKLGATLLIATRLDQSRRMGGILAAASTGLIVTEAGISPGVADGLVRMTPTMIAERLSIAGRAEPSAVPVPPGSTLPLALLARSRSEQPRSSS